MDLPGSTLYQVIIGGPGEESILQQGYYWASPES